MKKVPSKKELKEFGKFLIEIEKKIAENCEHSKSFVGGLKVVISDCCGAKLNKKTGMCMNCGGSPFKKY